MTKAMNSQTTGVLLMTYGSANTAEHVAPYLRHVYPGGVPEGLTQDFEERYRLVGRSPLVEITRQQASLTEALLHKQGQSHVLVRAAMLHSAPFIADVVGELKAAGATRLVGVILAPQFSSFIMQGYHTALQAAAHAEGYATSSVVVAEPWPLEPHFVQLLAKRTRDGLARLTAAYGVQPPVLFTTHSLPERVVAKDPSYLKQLTATTEAVVAELADPGLEWYQAYQSAGHTPEPWLKPDITDILDQIKQAKPQAKGILIVPLQFLADHLEILYDLDIAGGEQCQEHGLEYNRIELPNADPLFIQALAAIAGRYSRSSS